MLILIPSKGIPRCPKSREKSNISSTIRLTTACGTSLLGAISSSTANGSGRSGSPSWSTHTHIRSLRPPPPLFRSAPSCPDTAKIADLFSRPTAILISLVPYLVGTIAGSNNVQTVSAAQVSSTVGNTGLYFMQELIVADLTSIRWRGAVQGLLSLPFVTNAFVGADIATSIEAYSETAGDGDAGCAASSFWQR
ncbi:hypothetical protein I316_06402 [Kwoniella heveanensis BCC8398]|uniref:Uncharacterized protein n=1 Tax=Kwoniella heveanensis BCC8398 TaxID=1296120 RepID=A0A1B9GLX5_9TREE|nr:hypothetical protein I316_06402 [Kwoniella heveanensis BCC8398]